MVWYAHILNYVQNSSNIKEEVAGGHYDFTSPLEIIDSNAIRAMDYKELMDNSDENMKIEATKHLLGLAQRSTASFLYFCKNKIQELAAGN